jgi:hypothetical protein
MVPILMVTYRVGRYAVLLATQEGRAGEEVHQNVVTVSLLQPGQVVKPTLGCRQQSAGNLVARFIFSPSIL